MTPEQLEPFIRYGFAGLVLFAVLKMVVVPLVKQKAIKAENTTTSIKTEPGETTKMQALEVNVSTLKTEVIALDKRMGERIEGVEKAVEESGKNLDDKLDIILDEFRAHNRAMDSLREEITKQHLDFSQRLATAEADIRHLLKEHNSRQSRGD